VNLLNEKPLDFEALNVASFIDPNTGIGSKSIKLNVNLTTIIEMDVFYRSKKKMYNYFFLFLFFSLASTNRFKRLKSFQTRIVR
jgi:hypothetical protein